MQNYELVKSYKISVSESVTIAIDEDETSIVVFTKNNEKIGNINLVEVGTGYYITWMYLDQLSPKYKQKGIGQACLEFFIETYNMPVFAAQDDGHVKQDGSHLTGDAPAFISRMREKGIVT
ncbi:TPA: hypothetical protein NKV63_001718 [Vibrio parahaemolyticus]|nr:hypothetical protein [Vibrio parahaemolyticus]